MKALKSIMLAAVALTSITPAMAQEGPVASACKDDIATHCAGKSHQVEGFRRLQVGAGEHRPGQRHGARNGWHGRYGWHERPGQVTRAVRIPRTIPNSRCC